MYYVRRFLGFSAEEWRALPWHDQRMYMEELAVEMNGGKRAVQSDGDLLAMGFDVR